MRLRLTALAATAALAGCGGTSGNQTASNNEAAPVALDNAQQQVQGLDEGQRNGVIFRAIRDARQDCQNVISSMSAETSNGVPVYFATCENGAVYAVAFAREGNVSVRAVTPAEERK